MAAGSLGGCCLSASAVPPVMQCCHAAWTRMKRSFPVRFCRQYRPIGLLGGVLLLIIVAWGCGVHHPSATQQRSQGRALYQTHCAHCHGDQGQGKRGPALIGSIHGLRGYETSQGLYNYTSIVMPGDAAGTLQPDEYWAILAFILERNNMLSSQVVLGPENAESIHLYERR
jgi:mono/diheme cytochrome c family protein